MPNLKNNNSLTAQSGIIKYAPNRTVSATNLNSYINNPATKTLGSEKLFELKTKGINQNTKDIISDKDKMKIITKYNSVIDELENIELKKQLKTNDLIRISVEKIANFIVNLGKYKFTIEITSDDSIFFTIVMNKDIEIHYDFFVEEVGRDKEVLFSLYENKNCLIYGWDNIENSFERLNKVLESVK